MLNYYQNIAPIFNERKILQRIQRINCINLLNVLITMGFIIILIYFLILFLIYYKKDNDFKILFKKFLGQLVEIPNTKEFSDYSKEINEKYEWILQYNSFLVVLAIFLVIFFDILNFIILPNELDYLEEVIQNFVVKNYEINNYIYNNISTYITKYIVLRSYMIIKYIGLSLLYFGLFFYYFSNKNWAWLIFGGLTASFSIFIFLVNYQFLMRYYIFLIVFTSLLFISLFKSKFENFYYYIIPILFVVFFDDLLNKENIESIERFSKLISIEHWVKRTNLDQKQILENITWKNFSIHYEGFDIIKPTTFSIEGQEKYIINCDIYKDLIGKKLYNFNEIYLDGKKCHAAQILYFIDRSFPFMFDCNVDKFLKFWTKAKDKEIRDLVGENKLRFAKVCYLNNQEKICVLKWVLTIILEKHPGNIFIVDEDIADRDLILKYSNIVILSHSKSKKDFDYSKIY